MSLFRKPTRLGRRRLLHTAIDRLDLKLTAVLLFLGGGGAAHGRTDKSFGISGTTSSRRHDCSQNRSRNKDRNGDYSSKHVLAKYVANARLIAAVDTDRDHEIHGDYGTDDRTDKCPDHRGQQCSSTMGVHSEIVAPPRDRSNPVGQQTSRAAFGPHLTNAVVSSTNECRTLVLSNHHRMPP